MSDEQPRTDQIPYEREHPRGTLALVVLMGLFFAVGWVLMYFAFIARGAPTLGHP